MPKVRRDQYRDVIQLAEEVIVNEPFHSSPCGIESQFVIYHRKLAGSRQSSFRHPPGFSRIHRHRLFTDHMLTRGERGDRSRMMKIRRSAYDDKRYLFE